ncbi:MAG TPA: hypothetical protein VFY13_04100 [Luteolibacter sp.]|nr:hypothetical protein [Luteolibacter sp.]
MAKLPATLAAIWLLAVCVQAAAPLHPAMIRTGVETAADFSTSDPELQRLYETGRKQLLANQSEIAPGLTVLVEGGGYSNVWLETQPMGGEMYAKFNPQVALNNQLIFMRTQREDGRLPGMVVSGSRIGSLSKGGDGLPPGFQNLPELGLIADYEMIQGYCFPEPALRMNAWIGGNRDYLVLLDRTLRRFDDYLWRTRDSNGDGLLETWCVWDTGEDGCTRLHERGAPESWPHETAPASPPLRQGVRVPFQSMDFMAYSYSARSVLARIARELGNGEEQKWRDAAAEVRRRVVEKLWNEERKACFDRDRDGVVLDELIHNNLRCMWHGLFTQEMADAFIAHHLLNPDEFWTPVPLVSIARNEPLYLSRPRNNWSGQPQGLTYQRAIHALERYGHVAEVSLLGRKLLPVLALNNGRFSQQLDPINGKPSLSNSDGYGPMILAAFGYIDRMHGIHLDVERGEVWWSVLEVRGGRFKSSQRWAGHDFELELADGRFVAKVGGKVVFSGKPGMRVVSDLQGKVLAVVGIDSSTREVELQAGSRTLKGQVAPNQILRPVDSRLEVRARVAFDYPGGLRVAAPQPFFSPAAP